MVADLVLIDSEKLRDEVKQATGGAPIRLGLNAVGGESALRLMNCLAAGGTLVTFGAMSLQPLKIPNGLLIFKDLRFRGIWINKWYDNAYARAERMAAFNPIFEMAGRGLLQTKVEKSYPLNEIKAAVLNMPRPRAQRARQNHFRVWNPLRRENSEPRREQERFHRVSLGTERESIKLVGFSQA